MRKALTYDDINIAPKYSELGSRSDINTSTRFTKKINLNIPIVTSPMDTVTEYDMALEMMEWGGVGIIHRFMSIEKQSNIILKLHSAEMGSHWTDEEWSKIPRCAAIGVTGDYLERAQELFKNGCNVIVIDVAHGHHKLVGEAIEKIKTKL